MLQFAVGVELRVSRAHFSVIRKDSCAVVVALQHQASGWLAASAPARTRCAAIGSSRPPRSTSTASSILRRPAVVEQLVDRGADGAAGVEHVVDEDDVRAFDIERNVASALAPLVQAALVEVVAVEGDVDGAERLLARPSARCSRSASQAPPVWMPTSAVAGVTCGRISAASCAQQRFGVRQRRWHWHVRTSPARMMRAASASIARLALAPAARRARGARPRRRYRRSSTSSTGRRSGLRAGGRSARQRAVISCGVAIQRQRQADHQPRRLPFLDQLGDGGEAPVVGFAVDGGQGARPCRAWSRRRRRRCA